MFTQYYIILHCLTIIYEEMICSRCEIVCLLYSQINTKKLKICESQLNDTM